MVVLVLTARLEAAVLRRLVDVVVEEVAVLMFEPEEEDANGGGVAILSNADAEARMERGLASMLLGGEEAEWEAENSPPKND